MTMERNLLRLASIMCVFTFFTAGVCYALRTRAFEERENTAHKLHLLSDEGLISLAQHALSHGLAEKDQSAFLDIIQEFKRRGFNYCFVGLHGRALKLLKSRGWNFCAWLDYFALVKYLKCEGNSDYAHNSVHPFIVNSMQNISQHARRRGDVCLYLCKREHLVEGNINGFRVCVLDQGPGFKNDKRGGEDLPIKEALNLGAATGSHGRGGVGGVGLNESLANASFFRIETNDEKEIRDHEGRDVTFSDSERVAGHRHPALRIEGTIIDAIFWYREPGNDNKEWARYKADMVSRETARISGLITLVERTQLPSTNDHLVMNAAQEAV